MKTALWIAALAAVLGLGVYALSTAAVAQQGDAEGAVGAEVEKAEDAAKADGPDAEATKGILTLMELMGAKGQQEQVKMMILGRFRQMVPQAPPELWEKVSRRVSSDELTAALVPVYAKHLSKDDVKELVVFYESPLGKRFVKAQTDMQQDAQQASMVWAQKIQAVVAEELQALMQQQQQHQAEPKDNGGAEPAESPSGL
jgi:hypothetical protein